MDDSTLSLLIETAAKQGLLRTVTLVGGEPFFAPERLFKIIRKIWQQGSGTLEIFIPTNARWVSSDSFEASVAELVHLSQWFPYGLRVAFSRNEWNLAQLGALAPLVIERWEALEKTYPEVFYHRTLSQDEILPLGRAKKNALATPSGQVGVNCSFDDWYDPGCQSGFCTDYLAFYPNGECGLCYVYHSPVIGTVHDAWGIMLRHRREYLHALRLHIGGSSFATLGPNSCVICQEYYPVWLKTCST